LAGHHFLKRETKLSAALLNPNTWRVLLPSALLPVGWHKPDISDAYGAPTDHKYDMRIIGVKDWVIEHHHVVGNLPDLVGKWLFSVTEGRGLRGAMSQDHLHALGLKQLQICPAQLRHGA
jgi:hypothetical protein